jgi:hypothetical protein
MRPLAATTEDMLAPVARLWGALFAQILEEALRISGAANMNDVAKLLRSFQPPSDFGCADKDDVSVKTAATFEDRNTIGRQMILRL